MAWIDVAAAPELDAQGKLVIRHEGRQILLLQNAAGMFACVNRCPHEGYPLREGTLSGDGQSCVLTCNWHNWKFDLVSGATLVGGDKLRSFPTRRQGGASRSTSCPTMPRNAVAPSSTGWSGRFTTMIHSARRVKSHG